MNYLYKTIERSCPVCNSNKGKLLYEADAEHCARHFKIACLLDDLEDYHTLADHIRELWNKDSCAVVQCAACSFTFADPFIAGDHQFYNTLSPEGSTEPGPWKWEFSLTKKELSKLTSLHHQHQLLEIGSSSGGFIKHIAGELIPASNIVCLEYSEACVNELHKIGVNAFSCDVRSPAFQNKYAGQFDFICLFQVLEHLDEFEALFSAFHKLSAPGAKIYIAVPNGARIQFNELNKGLLDLPPNHLGRFNETSLNALALRFGWRIADLRLEQQSTGEILGGLLYYRSLQRRISGVKVNWVNTILDYIDINLTKLKIRQERERIGDNIWICLEKSTGSKNGI